MSGDVLQKQPTIHIVLLIRHLVSGNVFLRLTFFDLRNTHGDDNIRVALFGLRQADVNEFLTLHFTGDLSQVKLLVRDCLAVGPAECLTIDDGLRCKHKFLDGGTAWTPSIIIGAVKSGTRVLIGVARARRENA